MMTSTLHRKAVVMDWVLVANAARARCFVRDAGNNAMRELASFVHPQARQKGEALADDRGGHVQKGIVSTQFEPHTDLHAKQHAQFARELAQHLEAAGLAHRYPGLWLIASNPFLGELRAHLGDATLQLLKGSMALDLTIYRGAELEQRVAQALPAPESEP